MTEFFFGFLSGVGCLMLALLVAEWRLSRKVDIPPPSVEFLPETGELKVPNPKSRTMWDRPDPFVPKPVIPQEVAEIPLGEERKTPKDPY